MAQTNHHSPLEPTVSPLDEADPKSLDELIQNRLSEIFNKRPMFLSDDDLNVAIEYYRRERQRFLLESEAKAAKGPKEPRAAKRKVPTSVKEVLPDADDLI